MIKSFFKNLEVVLAGAVFTVLVFTFAIMSCLAALGWILILTENGAWWWWLVWLADIILVAAMWMTLEDLE